MKIQHYAIVFIIIILPFSIICRSKMANYGMTLKDQVRLNNVVDAATQDALDMLVELNDEFRMMSDNDPNDPSKAKNRFNITQQLAEQSVKSFFQTMAINFNMPYIPEKTESYFSMYIPAIVIVAYDGFFIYSVNESEDGTYAYHISPKIPYAYLDDDSGAMVHFTLGNDIKLFTADMFFEGTLVYNYAQDAFESYKVYTAAIPPGSGDKEALQIISDTAFELSTTIEAILQYDASLVPDFLVPPSGDDPGITSITLTDANSSKIPLLRDYDGKTDLEASNFHRIRRETIINLISDTLKEEINEHTSYASMFGSTYQFGLPDVARDDWMNSINDVSVMSFIQGMPIGVNEYYDNYALSGSRIVQTNYYYGGVLNGNKYYHRENCSHISGFADGSDPDAVDNIFITRVQAAESGYYPCALCHP